MLTAPARRTPKRPLPPAFREAVANAMDAWDCSWLEAVRYTRERYPEILREARERDAEKARLAALLAAWTHPAGTPVIVRLDDGSERETTTRSEAWMLGGHTPAVLLEGISGCYCLERVRRRETGSAS